MTECRSPGDAPILRYPSLRYFATPLLARELDRVRYRAARWKSMRFADALASGQFAIALEITPPQRSLPQVLKRRAGLLGELAMAVNVIQRAARYRTLSSSRASNGVAK